MSRIPRGSCEDFIYNIFFFAGDVGMMVAFIHSALQACSGSVAGLNFSDSGGEDKRVPSFAVGNAALMFSMQQGRVDTREAEVAAERIPCSEMRCGRAGE